MATIQTPKAALQAILNNLYHAAASRAFDYKAGVRRDAVFWLVKNGAWYSVRCVTVRWETPETLKFKNNGWSYVTKTMWPLPSVDHDVPELKIYLHASEVSDMILTKIVEAAEDPEKTIPDPLFENGQLTPWSAWSVKARAHYEKIEADRKAKMSRRTLPA